MLIKTLILILERCIYHVCIYIHIYVTLQIRVSMHVCIQTQDFQNRVAVFININAIA